jgi:putative hydrolase of the HAD superfamily
MIRAVLFDAAGTLIRLREPVGVTYSSVAREYGVVARAEELEHAFRVAFRRQPPMVFPGESPERITTLERLWWKDLVHATFDAVGSTTRFSNFDECFDELFSYFGRAQAWHLTPGALRVLEQLRTRGLCSGVVSNFDHRLCPILSGLGVRKLLDVVVRPADAGVAKPNPGIFELALRKLGVPASEALYVGDHFDEDIAGARSVGVQAVDIGELGSFTNVFEYLERSADH